MRTSVPSVLSGATAVTVLVALCLPAVGPAAAETPSWAREVIHYKLDPRTKLNVRTGSTESQSDPAKNMLIQLTRNAQRVEIARREFILDSQGRIRSGAIKDGQGRLTGRMQYGYDSYDRINEERLFHPSGRCIRRMLFKYDASSRRLVDRFYTWNRHDPYGPLVESVPNPGDDVAPRLPVYEGDRDLPGIGMPAEPPGVGLPQFRGTTGPAATASSAPAPTPAKPEKKGLFDFLKRKK